MRAWIAYFTLAVVWGSTYFGIALGIESFTPYGMVASRYLLAGILAFFLSRILKEPLPLKRDLPHLALQGLMLLSVSNALVTWAESRVPSGVTAVIGSTTPLCYALMGKERIEWRTWLGLALGISGVILLSGSGGARSLDLLGVAAILVAVVMWAYGTLHGRHHVQGRGLLGNVSVQMVAGGTMGLLLTPFTGGFLHAPLTLKATLAVGYLMLFGSLVAYSAFIYLAKVWSPTRMSTYVYLNPIVALLLGSIFLKEPFGLRMVMGVALMLSGVALVQLTRPAQRPTDETCPGEE